jgi:hypothetical protein
MFGRLFFCLTDRSRTYDTPPGKLGEKYAIGARIKTPPGILTTRRMQNAAACRTFAFNNT